MILDLIRRFEPLRFGVTIFVFILYSIVLSGLLSERKRIVHLSTFSLCALLLIEMLGNGAAIFKRIYWRDSNAHITYVDQQKEQIQDVEEYDDSFYRMEQSTNREENANKIHFDESLSYGYKSVSHYNSAFDLNVYNFISDLGYSDVNDIAVYGEPILSSDSLLGVKYLLSDQEFLGWDRVKELEKYNNKYVYQNPYALPLGFWVSKDVRETISNENPFEFQNEVYSKILGREVSLLKPIKSIAKADGEKIEFNLKGLEKEGIVYGYVRTNESNLRLNVNGEFRANYSTGLSYLVFNVGKTDWKNEVIFENYKSNEENIDAQFYYLDLEEFEKVIKEIKNKKVDIILLEDGKVQGSFNASESGEILLTVPYDEGWKVFVNDKEVKMKNGLNTFITLPVSEGENIIKMEYHVQGVKMGLVLTAISVIVFSILSMLEEREKGERKNGKDKTVIDSTVL